MDKPVLVIMAAGMGSRYGGLKQLDPVGNHDQVILDYSMYDARQAGFETVAKTLLGKVELSQQEAKDLKQLAKKGAVADSTIGDLKRELKSAQRDAQIWKRRYEELKQQTKDFLVAIKKAPERVRAFISKVLHTERAEQTKIHLHHEKAVER